MFAVVLQQEHKKLVAKTSKTSKEKKVILEESSNHSEEDMSVDHIKVSRTDKVGSPSEKLTDKMNEDKTCQPRI
jgi:hypothetical protein